MGKPLSTSAIATLAVQHVRRPERSVCVNAHDRCFGGAGGPCPYCEPKKKGRP